MHAGFRINNCINKAVYEIVFEKTASRGSHILFSREESSALTAAFLNSFYAHGADMDDGNKLAAGHIGAHVISSLMALAEERKASFQNVYTAMIAGYEVFCRLSSACMPWMVDRGFHSTGTAGALASAAACARLLCLDAEGVANAISLSATQASGLLLAGETRQDMKAINPANAARVGIMSALLAEKGIKGPLNPLESAKGWFHAMTPEVDFCRLFDGLGEKFAIDESYLKPYPSCRHTHCAIEAAVAVSKEIEPKEIKSIEVVTYGHAIDLAGRIDLPSTVGEAKFSMKYAVAIALSKGGFSLDDLSPKAANESIRMLVAKTGLVRDDTYENPEAGIRGSRLVVKTVDGRTLQKEVLVPKGDPENPFSRQDVADKLRSCFSDENGNPNPAGAEELLDWYVPIMTDPDREFVFPQKGAAR